MKKQYISLIIACSAVFLFLLSFIIYNQWPFFSGSKVVLATQPVDPFDLFKGQYLSIRYEISTINNALQFKEGDTVYVSLSEDPQGIWRESGVSKTKPSQGIFIKGKVKSAYELINVEYGIEQYFFERNANLPTGNITVEAAISNAGRAKIVQLLKDGKAIDIQYEDFDLKS